MMPSADVYNGMMSLYEASVTGRFRARHAIRLSRRTFEPSHQHTWNVTATFAASQVDPTTGVVVDFRKVEQALGAIADELEGEDLNALDFFADTGPSAERVAQYIAAELREALGGEARLYRVAVTEAPGCAAAFYPGGREG